MALDKVVDSAALDAGMAAVADEIRAKAGTTEPLAWPDGFRAAISGIETGGGGSSNPTATAKAVNFRDYDGTVLYSYTVEEAAALTELPPLPEHSGLVCQGWNWSLDGIKAMGRAVEVGAMYITDDGKTRIYIHLEDGRTSPMLGCCPNGTVTVDWGDGTEPDTLTGTSTSTVKWTPTHEYGAAGDYVIKLSISGSVEFAGNSSDNQYSYLLRYTSGADSRNQVYQSAIRKVEIGGSVTSIGACAFNHCYLLSAITIPNSVTSIGNSTFENCDSLSSVSIPNSVTSISSALFQYCNSLSSVTIPNSVTSIGSNAFINCYGVRYYDFTRHTAVPTLSNTNAFNNISADCEIRVPAALADEWKAATNWATYANKIVGV